VRKWKGVLASVLAEANGCVAWVRGLGPREQALCVIGREADREWVRALWEDLVPRVEWLSATAGPGEDRAWHESFRIGAADAIAARLRAGAAEAHQALSATALATVDPREAAHQQALDRFVDRHLGRARGRSIRVDADGLQRGRAAAAALPLPRSE
jgi:hypothetical protein